MESVEKLISAGSLCRSLRTKTMFYESDDAGSATSELHGPFWCSRTQGIFGPDDKVADSETCKPGRGCCETT